MYDYVMKTVIITGGSDGLGAATARQLACDYQVVILSRDEIKLQKLANEICCDWAQCDVRDSEQVTRVIDNIAKKHGSIDVIVNNAGVIVNGDLIETSDSDIENVIMTNAVGSIYVAKNALKHMKAHRKGLIINVVSQSGLNFAAGRSVYNASKWAMTGFTKALQLEAAQFGVRVTGFYPGTIKTDLFAKAGIDFSGNSLSTLEAAKSIEYLISLDDHIVVPEFGIKHQ